MHYAEDRSLNPRLWFVNYSHNIDDAGEPTTLLVDPSTPEGAGAGLTGPSLIKAYNLATVRQKRIIAVLGHLSDPLQQKLLGGLRVR